MDVVARIRAIARYPVKSMRGEDLETASLTFQGLAEDRRYAFVQAGSRSAFPWLTGRQYPGLLRYQPRVELAPDPSNPRVQVTTPEGVTLDVNDDRLRRALEAGCGGALFLMRDYRGNYDVSPVSIIAWQTIARIAAGSGTASDVRRFRPNLLVDVTDGGPAGEMGWVGRILRVGDRARLAVTEPDHRCVMITLDPATTEADPRILRWVAQQHGGVAGIHATVLAPGDVRVGDPIVLEA
ncbi:MAG TPA: MOSC N-terminal beta barrel domain-containing protein [bacterium]|nr:MOSC N-terminal beta barrel domain-containing protein [bacterium]